MRPWTQLLDLIFPVKCPFCQKILADAQGIICPLCQKKLPWLIGDQSKARVEFSKGCYAPLAYRDAVPDAVHRYKFSGIRAYAQPFGQLMAQCALDHQLQQAQLVTWAPLSAKRLRKRGYDQARLLAQVVGAQLNLPVCATLEKTLHTPPQSGLDDASRRRANARGAYRMDIRAEVAGKTLILVDDVMTSGATLGECAFVLSCGGVREIHCLTLARAGEGEKIVGING